MCGEQVHFLSDIFHKMGSPPRVRGTDLACFADGITSRITPACAGNRIPLYSLRKSTQDHPRVCGEQIRGFPLALRYKGSPPRVRGTVINATWEQVVGRITPACAGNSENAANVEKLVGDHPRVCGEQRPPPCRAAPPPGSPPRVRGTDGHMEKLYGRMRITPACAGNRKTKHHENDEAEDHPRVCGEQLLLAEI